MGNKSIADFIKPTIITGQQYGTKVSVEINHSDTDIDELFEAFKTIIVGLGYHDSAWKQWIVDTADEYKEEELENAKDMGIYEPSPELRRAAEEYVKMLSEKEIDEALAEHNRDEELISDFDSTLNDGLNEIDWTDEMEEQYWKEQCPHPFATDIELPELEKYDDYGQLKTPKKEKKIKKKSKK
jgi:hypothetical protein